MLASIVALIVVFLLAGFWLRYHKTVPTPSLKGTPVRHSKKQGVSYQELADFYPGLRLSPES